MKMSSRVQKPLILENHSHRNSIQSHFSLKNHQKQQNEAFIDKRKAALAYFNAGNLVRKVKKLTVNLLFFLNAYAGSQKVAE